MLDTDLKIFEHDLEESIEAFKGSENLRIRHRFTRSENKFVNTVTVNGNTMAFGNLVCKFSSEIEEKRMIKRYAKLSLYKALSKHFNLSLPWGALTGIRPTKLAYSEIEEGKDFSELFIDTMKVSKEKTQLTLDVINTQKPYYEKNKDNCDLFIFIPFCPSRCNYCSFICTDIKTSLEYVDCYADYLVKEIEKSGSLIKKLRSIYIGGGTPVALSNSNLEKILKAVEKINTGVEFTVEAGRPDRINKENLKLFKDYGVTRICINPQTFNDETLKRIGRNHTSLDIIKSYDLAKNDFAVNMDLICGLDGETFDDFYNTLTRTLKLSPDNVTVHTLCVKRGSDLSYNTENVDAVDVSKMVDFARETLTEKGYNPYYLYRQKYQAENLENVGYSKKGKECIYNIDTMEEISNCIACGANGISKKIDFEGKIERLASPKDVKTYIKKVDEIIVKKREFFIK